MPLSRKVRSSIPADVKAAFDAEKRMFTSSYVVKLVGWARVSGVLLIVYDLEHIPIVTGNAAQEDHFAVLHSRRWRVQANGQAAGGIASSNWDWR